MNGFEAYGHAQILLVEEQHRIAKVVAAYLSRSWRRRFIAANRQVKAAAGR